MRRLVQRVKRLPHDVVKNPVALLAPEKAVGADLREESAASRTGLRSEIGWDCAARIPWLLIYV